MLMTLIAFVAMIAMVVGWQLFKAHRTIEDLLKTNERLEAEKQVQAVILEQKNAEVKNVQIQRKHNENVKRTSSRRVDEQLHVKGYFRDE